MRRILPILVLPFFAACSSIGPAAPDEPTGKNEPPQMADHVKVLRDLPLDTTITGRFDRKERVYGFVFEARAGATIRARVETRAGSDADRARPGAALDTIAAVFGPMNGNDRGERLAQEDDGAAGVAAALPNLSIKQDGRYLLVFSSWDDPGSDGSFSVKAGCDGTDFQCTRPVAGDSCTPGTRYVQGGTVIDTETWSACNVVLLEEVHVKTGAVLTIAPGVTVKGNYIGTGAYGNVALVVDGTVQAVGTKDKPVLFTALTAGWKGLVLNGASSTLQHVFVEKAETGVVLNGSGSTLRDVNVNTGELGLRFGPNTKDNKAERVRIAQIGNGIRLDAQSQASIDDSVILGRGTTGVGIQGVNGGLSQFRRALVAGFADGLNLNASALEVYDGTITNNTRGVFIDGPNGGVSPARPACPQNQPQPPPPPPPAWGRDPVFVRCDIVKNREAAIRLNAPELLVVEESNIRGNGLGIVIEANSLHPDSRIVRSNVFGNGAGPQVDAFHTNGRLDISGNYWARISDPELSTSWRMTHSQSFGCPQVYAYNPATGRTEWHSPSVTATWTGEFTFTGFSPAEVAAGPRAADLCDDVKNERVSQSGTPR